MSDQRPIEYVRAEMEAYDRLGPLARAAISNNPIELGIGRVLAAAPGHFIDDYGRWDDVRLAAWLKSETEKRKAKPFGYFVLERKGRAHISMR